MPQSRRVRVASGATIPLAGFLDVPFRCGPGAESVVFRFSGGSNSNPLDSNSIVAISWNGISPVVAGPLFNYQPALTTITTDVAFEVGSTVVIGMGASSASRPLIPSEWVILRLRATVADITGVNIDAYSQKPDGAASSETET